MPGVGPYQSIAAGTSAAVNGSVLNLRAAYNNHTIVVTAAGAPTAGDVQLEVSQDGANWYAPAGGQLAITAVGVQSATITGAFAYVRAAITTLITGGTIGATVSSC